MANELFCALVQSVAWTRRGARFFIRQNTSLKLHFSFQQKNRKPNTHKFFKPHLFFLNIIFLISRSVFVVASNTETIKF